MDISEALATFGVIGGFLVAASSFLFGKKPEQTIKTAVQRTEEIVQYAEEGIFDAFSAPISSKLSREEVYVIAQEISKMYGGRIDPLMLLTFAEIESSYRPWVERYEPHIKDYSVGLMQTLIKTAQEMYERGNNRFARPTRETLKNPVISMYYGAAYIDWLKRSYSNKGLEWWVRAYNGGAGHKYNSMTTNYWAKWVKAYKRNGGGTGIGLTFS